MTQTKTIVALVAFAALVATIPSLTQVAEASSVVYAQPNYPQMGFDQTIYFTYEIDDVTKTVSYGQGCGYDRVYVTAGTYETSDLEFISWTFTDNVNGLCNFSEYSSYTNFNLDSVSYTMTGPSGTVSGSSNSNQGSEMFYDAFGNSGTVHVTITGHYQYSPTPASP